MITPPVVIWLSCAYGWRSAFLLTGLLAVVFSGLWYWLYRDPRTIRACRRKSAP